jgi:hypothetical protein
MNPADLPDLRDAGPEPGLVRLLLFLGCYVLVLVGAVVYLVRKLPRSSNGQEPDGEADEPYETG